VTSTPYPSATGPVSSGVIVPMAPLGTLLLQVVRLHRRLAERLLRDDDLVPPQEIVLMYLDERGATPQSELVRYLGRDRSTITATLQAMERLGLVSRAPSPADRRAVTVTLTETGSTLGARARASWSRLEKLTFGPLTQADRDDLARALVKVRDALGLALADEV
jgi:MarR family transcriptional regulator, lower aerobic nicotinate degradation pathway regulator